VQYVSGGRQDVLTRNLPDRDAESLRYTKNVPASCPPLPGLAQRAGQGGRLRIFGEPMAVLAVHNPAFTLPLKGKRCLSSKRFKD
jgi:hypothetical protein